MIEEIYNFFTTEMIYFWVNFGVLPFWLILIFFPQSNLAKYFVTSIFPTLILSPLVFLGGSLYSINWLPEFWQNVSLVNPVLYLVSGFRWSFYEMADVSITTSLIMIFSFLILNITAIIYIFSKGFKIKD